MTRPTLARLKNDAWAWCSHIFAPALANLKICGIPVFYFKKWHNLNLINNNECESLYVPINTKGKLVAWTRSKNVPQIKYMFHCMLVELLLIPSWCVKFTNCECYTVSKRRRESNLSISEKPRTRLMLLRIKVLRCRNESKRFKQRTVLLNLKKNYFRL